MNSVQQQISNPANPKTAEAISDVIIPLTVITLPYRGNFVYKQDIRSACALTNNYRWTQHIKYCRKFQKKFKKSYKKFALKNSVTKHLAMQIVNQAFQGTPYEIHFEKIEYC